MLFIVSWFFILSPTLLLLLIFIKGALVPTHTWFLKTITKRRNFTFIWSITIHKLPIFAFFTCFASSFNSKILIISMFLGSLLFLLSNNIRLILIISSGNTIASIFFLNPVFKLFRILLLLSYWGILLRSIILEKILVSGALLFLGLSGVPPLFFFQMKFIIIETLLVTQTWIRILLLLFRAILSAFVYLRLLLLFQKENNHSLRKAFFTAWIPLSLFRLTF